MERLMGRVVSPVLSAYYRDLHTRHGVDVRLGAAVTGIIGEAGRVASVVCADGTKLPADLVVVGIGVIPNDGLAGAAGLACDRGIVVDALLRTADPAIYAIGDCAAFPHPMAQGLIRLESVQNAVDQGKAVADAIMGAPKPYTAVPWFWSDQYDVKLQIVGLHAELRRHRHTWRGRRGPFLRALFPQRLPDRHRFGEQAKRPCGWSQAVRRRKDGYRGRRPRSRL